MLNKFVFFMRKNKKAIILTNHSLNLTSKIYYMYKISQNNNTAHFTANRDNKSKIKFMLTI